MRRNLSFVWVIAALLIASVSCENEKEPSRLDVEYPGYDILAQGGTASFAVKSNVEWEVANADGWITEINPAKGNADGWVTVTFAPNADLQERSSVFTITSEAATKTVPITQAGAETTPAFTVNYTPAAIPATGGTASFTVQSDMNWTVDVKGEAAWLTPSVTSGSGDATVTVAVAANDSFARGGIVKVTAGNFSESVTIRQDAAEFVPALTVDYTPADISSTGGTTTFKVTSNVTWTATCPDTWVAISPVQGTGETNVTVTIAANPAYNARTATIAINGGGLPGQTVTITQLPRPVLFSDYLGDYTFNADFFVSDPSTAVPTTYSDIMNDGTLYGENEMYFVNAINEYVTYGTPTYIDFYYDNGKLTYLDYGYIYYLSSYRMYFTPCVLVGASIGFVWDMELELDMATGKITFPTTFTHSSLGTAQAHYVIWTWSASTGASAGRWSDNFMTNVVATKTGSSPAPAKSSATGDQIVKIPVKITPPKGFDPNSVVSADQIALRK